MQQDLVAQLFNCAEEYAEKFGQELLTYVERFVRHNLVKPESVDNLRRNIERARAHHLQSYWTVRSWIKDSPEEIDTYFKVRRGVLYNPNSRWKHFKLPSEDPDSDGVWSNLVRSFEG